MIDTCHDWHRLPSEFGLCEPADDMALMSAFSGTVATMRSWERQENERESREQEARRSARKGKR